MITLNCPCGKKLQVRDEFAGQKGKCPLCGRTLDIPDGKARDEPAEPPAYKLSAVETTAEDFGAGDPVPPPPAAEPARPKRRPRRGDGWAPAEELTNHAGKELGRKDDFFAPPPAEIGEVLSAYTSLRTDSRPMTPEARLGVAVTGGVGGLIVGVLIAINLESPFFQLLWPVALAGVGMGIVLLSTGFSNVCTYVGREGIAKYTCTGGRENVREEVFCFKDAAELRTSQTRHYTNGVYTNTAYSFEWKDVAGRLRHRVRGSHRSESNNPPAKHEFHFATRAEWAWTMYLLEQVQAQLQTQGTVYFGLGGKDWVRLGEVYVCLFFKGQTIECDAAEIAQVRIQEGWVQVRRKDATKGWFSSRGVFKFPYGSLANAQLFLILMDKLVGVPIND